MGIDWGGGSLWRPLNMFGAFAPTDLDTEFKPGIDALAADWHPTPFSSLSAALRYREPAGGQSEVSLLAASVLGHTVLGGSLEGAWGDAGWRVETARCRLDHTGKAAWFTVAGVDRQLDDGTVVVAEWHHNTNGARTRRELAEWAPDPREPAGLRQQLGRDTLGIALERQLTPLLAGSYLYSPPRWRTGGEEPRSRSPTRRA